MNPFLLDPKERLKAWKGLRAQIASTESVVEQMDLALNFWKQAPLEKPILDWDNCQSWPTPWEMLHTNRFCESTLSLAVGYSLVLSSPHNYPDLELVLITDRLNHVQKVLARTQEWTLNHSWLDRLPRYQLQNVQIHSKWHYNGKAWQE